MAAQQAAISNWDDARGRVKKRGGRVAKPPAEKRGGHGPVPPAVRDEKKTLAPQGARERRPHRVAPADAEAAHVLSVRQEGRSILLQPVAKRASRTMEAGAAAPATATAAQAAAAAAAPAEPTGAAAAAAAGAAATPAQQAAAPSDGKMGGSRPHDPHLAQRSQATAAAAASAAPAAAAAGSCKKRGGSRGGDPQPTTTTTRTPEGEAAARSERAVPLPAETTRTAATSRPVPVPAEGTTGAKDGIPTASVTAMATSLPTPPAGTRVRKARTHSPPRARAIPSRAYTTRE